MVRLTATCMSWPHITIVQRGRRTHLQLYRKKVPPYSEKNITLKYYMIHVLKIGRTLRHYMLPCQTANQHFCTFLKRVGVVVGVMVGVMVGVKGPATLCILYFVYSAGHTISMQCWSSLIELPTFTNSRQFLECITFIIPQQIFRWCLRWKEEKDKYSRWIDQEEHQFLSSHLGVNAIRNRSS